MMFRPVDYYKPDLAKTLSVQRCSHRIAIEKLHNEGSVTFRALPPSDVSHFTTFDLTKYRYDTDLYEYADAWLEALEQSMTARRNIDDNFIPNISPMLGIGDYSAFVAGEIYFAKDTSWSSPVLEKPEDYKNLPTIGSAPWYGKFLTICERMLEMTKGTGIPFMRGFFSPLDLAAALRGEGIYYDFYDRTEALHELLNYCADCTIRFTKDLYALAGKYLSGTEYGMFFLDGINMSEDIACMISAELYREFCAPHTQKVIDAFGKGYMHCHSRAMYLVPEICALDNVATLWLATDPNQPRPIECIEELVREANCVCLNIDCEDFAEIEKNEAALKKGNFSVCLPVSGLEEAERLAKRANQMFGLCI